jgi:hypothetical protein
VRAEHCRQKHRGEGVNGKGVNAVALGDERCRPNPAWGAHRHLGEGLMGVNDVALARILRGATMSPYPCSTHCIPCPLYPPL